MYARVIHTEFATVLRRSGKSQAALARLCGVTAVAVNYWCKGTRPVPQWAWIIAQLGPTASDLKPPALEWYELLGVDKGADTQAVRSAWSKLARKYHADVGGDDETMKRINAAYEAARRR